MLFLQGVLPALDLHTAWGQLQAHIKGLDSSKVSPRPEACTTKAQPTCACMVSLAEELCACAMYLSMLHMSCAAQPSISHTKSSECRPASLVPP